jgi:hypothetical protein
MTVTYLGEDPSGRRANNKLGVRTYTRVFKFETSDQAEDAWDVGSHASAPLIGDVFHDAWCNAITPENNNPWKGWQITAEYSSERELATDPTTDPAIIKVSTEQFQREAVVTNTGDLICNSAGDPFDPPLMMDDSRRVIHISKNMSGHPSWLLDYADVVNSDSFTVKGITYTAGQGKVQRVSIGEEQVRNGVTFVVVDIEIHLQKNGWPIDRIDAGFRQTVYSGRENIRNSIDEELPAAPVPLDGSGTAIADPTPATNVLLQFGVYATNVFSALPLI